VIWATLVTIPVLLPHSVVTRRPTLNPSPSGHVVLVLTSHPPRPAATEVEEAEEEADPPAPSADCRSATTTPPCLAVFHFPLLFTEPQTTEGVIGMTLATAADVMEAMRSEHHLVLLGCVTTMVMTLLPCVSRMDLTFARAVGALAA
jgi:hypothetical protein